MDRIIEIEPYVEKLVIINFIWFLKISTFYIFKIS
jgi:hypothetical protein